MTSDTVRDLVADLEAVLDDRPQLALEPTFERGLQAVRQLRYATAQAHVREAWVVLGLLRRFGAPGSTIAAVSEAHEVARQRAASVGSDEPHPALQQAWDRITGEVISNG